MSRRYYFVLTSLPALPELGESPPLGLLDFRALAGHAPTALPLIDALLLEQDLLSREAALAGEIERAQPVVLTAEQAAGTEPLPGFLTAEAPQARRIPADVMWEAYYRFVHRLAGAKRCAFARRWVGFEVALRNALAAARARALDLDAEQYVLAAELADGDGAAEEVVSAWSAAEDPLAALRVLDQRRWAWMEENSRYFSFALDELAAYARKLVSITRWRVLAREESPAAQRT